MDLRWIVHSRIHGLRGWLTLSLWRHIRARYNALNHSEVDLAVGGSAQVLEAEADQMAHWTAKMQIIFESTRPKRW